MKAFLLAAGSGSRLYPITGNIPKCMIEIAGKPLLSIWMELFCRHGVSEVLINTHHRREQVSEYIRQHNGAGRLPRLKEYYEETLLGSGGTVLANRDFVPGEESFFICYADILTSIDLTAMQAFHKTHGGVLTMALAPTGNPEQSGIASIDETGLITGFEEKPSKPKGSLANAGIYIARQEIFSLFTHISDNIKPADSPIDFASDILPGLIGQMYGCIVREYHIDIGTPENLEKARRDYSV